MTWTATPMSRERYSVGERGTTSGASSPRPWECWASGYYGLMSTSERPSRRPFRLKRNGNGTGEEDTRGRRKPASKKVTSQSDVHGVGEAEARQRRPEGPIHTREATDG